MVLFKASTRCMIAPDLIEMNQMKSKQIKLRCYAELKNGQWTAVCIDLCLAAQADSCKQATESLKEIVDEFLYDITEGEDKNYATQLISRKAPLHQRIKYHGFKLLNSFHRAKNFCKIDIGKTIPTSLIHSH